MTEIRVRAMMFGSPGCECEGEPTGCSDPEACNYDSFQ